MRGRGRTIRRILTIPFGVIAWLCLVATPASAQLLDAVTDPLPEPVTETVRDVSDPVTGTVDGVIDTGTEILAPVTETAADVAEPVVQTAVDAVEPAVAPAVEVAEPVLAPVAVPAGTVTGHVSNVVEPVVDTNASLDAVPKPVVADAAPPVSAVESVVSPLTSTLGGVTTRLVEPEVGEEPAILVLPEGFEIPGTLLPAVTEPVFVVLDPGTDLSRLDPTGSAISDLRSDDMISPLPDTVSEVLDAAIAPTGPMLDTVSPALGQLDPALEPVTGGLASHVLEPVTPILGTVLQPVKPTVDNLAPVLDPVVSTIANVHSPVPALTPVVDFLGTVVRPVVDAVPPVVEPVLPSLPPIAGPDVPVSDPITVPGVPGIVDERVDAAPVPVVEPSPAVRAPAATDLHDPARVVGPVSMLVTHDVTPWTELLPAVTGDVIEAATSTSFGTDHDGAASREGSAQDFRVTTPGISVPAKVAPQAPSIGTGTLLAAVLSALTLMAIARREPLPAFSLRIPSSLIQTVPVPPG